jgi:tetratricopeptide (TPR) repeat protein
MTTATQLRAAVIGLIGLAATEEEMLLASTGDRGDGSPDRWAALPLIAHNAEFRQQQVTRLQAIRHGQAPPVFTEVDHRSPQIYQRYCAATAAGALTAARQSAGELISLLRAVSDEDLTDASRHPWLRGRQLWLQIVVRGFWHPTGHLGDYYLARNQSGRAVALHQHALAAARYLAAPGPAIGMAAYSLACAQAQTGAADDALHALTQALTLNPDLRANAQRDPDLARLRDSGQLEPLLTPAR